MTEAEYKRLEEKFGYKTSTDEVPKQSKWQRAQNSAWTLYLGVPAYMVVAVVVSNYVGPFIVDKFLVL